jgi:hypothetical protein
MQGSLNVKKEKNLHFPEQGNVSSRTNVVCRKIGILLHCIESISDRDWVQSLDKLTMHEKLLYLQQKR